MNQNASLHRNQNPSQAEEEVSMLDIYVTVAHKKQQGVFCLHSLFKSCGRPLRNSLVQNWITRKHEKTFTCTFCNDSWT